MPVCEILNKDKNKVGDIELNEAVFGREYEGKNVVLYEVIKMQMAAWRSGTHSTKTYATISGGNSKPFRQKGTGRARRGTMRASTLRGGAVAMGPHPRDYSYTVPKKKRKVAVSTLLSERLATGRLYIIDKFDFQEIKTKEARNVLKNVWNLRDAVIVGGDVEEKFILSLRNLQDFLYIHYTQANLYDLMAYKHIILTEEAAKHLNEVLGL